MNVLVVVAHPDDEALGCGGTLLRLAAAGHTITTCVLVGDAEARYDRPQGNEWCESVTRMESLLRISDSLKFTFPNIGLNAVPHLEVVQAIEESIRRFRPEWIFTHHSHDLNIDHRVCSDATMVAASLPRRGSSEMPPTQVRRIDLFEVPSSTDWAFPSDRAFQPNTFVDISETLEGKLDALAAFSGALKSHPHSRSRENISNLARLRGGQAGTPAAEAFSMVWNVFPDASLSLPSLR